MPRVYIRYTVLGYQGEALLKKENTAHNTCQPGNQSAKEGKKPKTKTKTTMGV